jgi:colanic acid/amylovoran biosynthesis glycosyltransferase
MCRLSVPPPERPPGPYLKEIAMTLSAPPRSPRIGYVLKRYPRFSETFVVNEILAHEAAGQEIEIFALRPVQETHFQDAISRVRAPVTHVPYRHRTPDMLWAQLARAEAAFPGAAARAMAAAARPRT